MINLPLIGMFVAGAVVGGLGVDWWRDRKVLKNGSVVQPGPREFSDTPFNADDVERKKTEVQVWMMQRKLDAGLIAKECLDEILHARNACETVFQVVKNLNDIASSLAELVGIGEIAEVIKSSNANEKEIMLKLKSASAIGKMAATSLVPAVEKLQEVKTLLQSTGWLSDYPPVDCKLNVKEVLASPEVSDVSLDLDLGDLEELEVPEVKTVVPAQIPESLVDEKPAEIVNSAENNLSLGLDLDQLEDDDEEDEDDDENDEDSTGKMTVKKELTPEQKTLRNRKKKEREKKKRAEIQGASRGIHQKSKPEVV